MKTRLVPLLWLGLVAAALVPSASSDFGPPQTLREYRFYGQAGPKLDVVAREFEVRPIHPGRRDGFLIYVPAGRERDFELLLPEAHFYEADVDQAERSAMRETAERAYKSYADVVSLLQDTAAAHPKTTRLEIYGETKERRDLYVLHLTDPIQSANFRPGLLITGATHGNELIGTEVALGVLEKILAGIEAKDPLITKLVSRYVLYFIPVINADGYTRRDRYSNGVDPNREFPYPTKPNRTPNECIAAAMDFFENHNITAAIDYHSYGGIVGFPWSYTRTRLGNVDYERHRTVAAKMAAQAGYRSGQIPDVLYIAQGSSGDYWYWKEKTLSFVVEIGDAYAPPASTIPSHVERNWKAIRELFTHLNAR